MADPRKKFKPGDRVVCTFDTAGPRNALAEYKLPVREWQGKWQVVRGRLAFELRPTTYRTWRIPRSCLYYFHFAEMDMLFVANTHFVAKICSQIPRA